MFAPVDKISTDKVRRAVPLKLARLQPAKSSSMLLTCAIAIPHL